MAPSARRTGLFYFTQGWRRPGLGVVEAWRRPWQRPCRRLWCRGMDKVSPAERSAVMARVKGRDTGPEKRLRSLLFRQGFRFRLHKAELPGTPDIVLPRYRTAVFVNGCFWHRHAGCRRASMPASNVAYWERKFQRTVARDAAVTAALEAMGWQVVVVWECELSTLEKDCGVLAAKIRQWVEAS